MVNIVVVCWNALNYTKVALTSLVDSVKNYEDIRLTIIDNGSVDETPIFLKSFALSCPIKTKIIKNKTNLGIGHAYNQGLKESIKTNSKYTVFCNNDLLFTENWVYKMQKIMDNNPIIAMLGPLVPSSSNFYDENRTIKEVLLGLKNTSSPENEISEFIGKHKDINSFVKNVCEVNKKRFGCDVRKVRFPNAISSCVVMTRTIVFSDLGYFANPQFKEYGGEDIDICWRVLKRGLDIAITNDVYVHHYRGKSIKVAKFNRVELIKKSNKKLFNIWKNDIRMYYRGQGIKTARKIPNTPENWLINELKKDVDIDEVLKDEE